MFQMVELLLDQSFLGINGGDVDRDGYDDGDVDRGGDGSDEDVVDSYVYSLNFFSDTESEMLLIFLLKSNFY